ncbi:sensor histidine kinase [Massilia yuzhufengensis]|uniref:Histidine kinase n=1 Tax=Massilia yuzhufengensis TaxID=1164594 RepID=A0A1I1UIX0_9BURK|nr:histidine kinase [Massilia yuzhufengensis]SFD70796.1 Histidine kinase [Massilia yuzhufengensis]
MWRSIVNWYDTLEQEQLAVMKDPSLAAHAPKGFRRWNATKLAAMSPLERARLHEFCVAYRGARLWKAIAAFTAAFTVAGVLAAFAFPKGGFVTPVVLANLLGFSLLMGAVGTWFNPSDVMKKKRKMIVGSVVGALLGALGSYTVLMIYHGKPLDSIFPRLSQLALGAIVGGMGIYIPVLTLGAYRRRQYEIEAAQLQQHAERERLAREVSESQLRMLRAQIEPHFLFNTLGAVQQLAADGAPRAASLTGDLIAFLRASFSDMRSEQVSLASEFATIGAYLRVMQARMGARLRFELLLPEELKGVPVPSMIVLTLAENAIKHGIEPSLRGGEIRIAASSAGGRLTVCVHDSGVGMSDTPGDGAGLDNVRRRLQLAYGDGAGLVLREAYPGLMAELTMPVTAKEPA